MPAAPDDWRRMGQENWLLDAALERRPYRAPGKEGLRAWRSPSRGVVVEGGGASPPAEGIFAEVDDWEEVAPRGWDHDHCEFCGVTFKEEAVAPEDGSDPAALGEGYMTAGPEGDRWICERCFADFRDEFRWTVAGERS